METSSPTADGTADLATPDGAQAAEKDGSVFAKGAWKKMHEYWKKVHDEAAGELHIPMLGIHLDKEDVGRFFHLVETGALS